MAPAQQTKPLEGVSILDGTRRHLLDLDDFSMHELELVLQTTDVMRGVLSQDVKKLSTLQGKVVITLFQEASTRTRVSFEEAGKILSADVINISDSGSSIEKGESLLNTALTLQATGTDLLVVRHAHSGAPYFIAKHLSKTGVVNAGDGSHAHPTQALLDLYTMKRHLGDLKGRKVVIVGDVLHSRVARSNIWGLSLAGARVVLCGPPNLLPIEFLHGSHRRDGNPLASVEVELEIERAVAEADVVMPLRLQLERQHAAFLPTLREYSKTYGITQELLDSANPGALLMHPGPMNEGVEVSPEVAHGSQSVIEEQVYNGVAIRMAILKLLLNPSG